MKKIYVVGIGPGAPEEMTFRARHVLEAADLIAGYGKYIDLLRPIFPEKEYLQNGMTGEVKRCEMALEQAEQGKTVAMVSSGDAGIYGMAGLVLELAQGRDVEVEIVPGLTAASSGAALLGAPLMHDFAVISLSDRLTQWDLIQKRLHCAAEADFNIVLYNPRSKGRPDYIAKACEIVRKYKDGATPVGIVKNIGRAGESTILTTLDEIDIQQVDMFSTVFIGNSQTYLKDGKMITPRGYLTQKEPER